MEHLSQYLGELTLKLYPGIYFLIVICMFYNLCKTKSESTYIKSLMSQKDLNLDLNT